MDICDGVKKNGLKCTYKAKFNGKCGIHKNKISEVPKMRIALTFTYGQIENGIGMEKIGKLEKRGYTIEDLNTISKTLAEKNIESEVIILNSGLEDILGNTELAGVLVIRNCVNSLLMEEKSLFQEQKALVWDKHKFNPRGRKIVNSRARYNLCYADFSQKNNYEDYTGKVPEKAVVKGTVVDFNTLPITNKLRSKLVEILIQDEEIDGGRPLLAEGNNYFDSSLCGIGFHGDVERKTVVCVCLGESTNLDYQWFQKKKPIGKTISIKLNHGDVYIMSEKAVGGDWRKSANNLCSLRHAAGCVKYRTVKNSE